MRYTRIMTKPYIQIYRAPYKNPMEIEVNSYADGIDFVHNPRKRLSVPLKRNDLICLNSGHVGPFSYVNSKLKVISFADPLLNIETFLGQPYSSVSQRFTEVSILAYEYGYAINVFWQDTTDVRMLMMMAYLSGIDRNKFAKMAYEMLMLAVVRSNMYGRKNIQDIVKPFVDGSLTNEAAEFNANQAILDLERGGTSIVMTTGADEWRRLFWAGEIIPSLYSNDTVMVKINHFEERISSWIYEDDDDSFDKFRSELLKIFHKHIKLEDVLRARYS